MIEELMQGATANPRGFGGNQTPEEMQAESTEPTPEEQEQYDLMVIRARKMIFGDAKEDLLEMMGASQSPAQGMGEAAALLVKMMTDAMKNEDGPVDPEVAINAGTEIIEDLNDLGKNNGIFEYDSDEDEDQELADAVLWGVKKYGDGMIQSGEITPEMQQMGQQVMQQGMDEEMASVQQARATPKKTGVAEAVGGVINGAMGGGM